MLLRNSQSDTQVQNTAIRVTVVQEKLIKMQKKKLKDFLFFLVSGVLWH